MTAWKLFVKSLHDLTRWLLRLAIQPVVGVLEAISKACQKLADELGKV